MPESMKHTLDDETLIIELNGRIDSTNAPGTEKQIEDIRTSVEHDRLVLDAKDLSYISSAGLRVILRLRKEYPGLQVKDVNPDVYEIFEMTGFTEMIDVQKAYRVLSVDDCEIVGMGSNGAVYRIDRDTIVKVYFDKQALPDIHRERELARKAFVLGIPTAIPYDVVKIGDSYGSVFELLNAESFTNIIAKQPERTDEIVAMFVDLLKKIHKTEVDPKGLPDAKQVALGWVDDLERYLAPDKWAKLRALVEAVPSNCHMIHGDYHTKNVMLQDGEALLIDMDTLSYGDPIFEFASVFNAFRGFYDGYPPVDGDSFIGIPFKKGLEVFDKTLRGYFDTDDEMILQSVIDKSAILGYTRILRRIHRRCDMNDPLEQAAVSFYKKAIEELVDRIDDLRF